jgi:nucleotide-binding universal stress UspA family protein
MHWRRTDEIDISPVGVDLKSMVETPILWAKTDDDEERKMFHKILVATGGSPWSSNAVDTAIRLAACLQAELVIVHILEDDPQYQPRGLEVSDPQLREQMEGMGKQLLQNAAQRAADAHITSHTVSQWGEIPEQVVHLAQTTSCDLIVMGTRHLTGDKRLMSGRICNAVLATAPCPVLVVPLVQ